MQKYQQERQSLKRQNLHCVQKNDNGAEGSPTIPKVTTTKNKTNKKKIGKNPNKKTCIQFVYIIRRKAGKDFKKFMIATISLWP